METHNRFAADLTEDDIAQRLEADNELERVRYGVQSFDVDGLIRRLKNKDLIIPSFQMSEEQIDLAGFQREFVWNKNQMDSFIESILMKYPTQGIFFVEQEDESYLVLDGQQRLMTLAYFKDGKYPFRDSFGRSSTRNFRLESVSDEFRTLSYNDLTPQQKRTFNNYIFSATIIRTFPNSGNRKAIYQIFERINSKGTLLNPHEIRIAAYAGSIINYIENLNNDDNWRSLYGKKEIRLGDHELITRIFAMFLRWDNYNNPLKSFLGDFYSNYTLDKKVPRPHDDKKELKKIEDHNKKVDANRIELDEVSDLFKKTCQILVDSNIENIFNPLGKKNLAWIDSLFCGIMTALKNEKNLDNFPLLYENLLKKASKDSEKKEFLDSYSRRASDKNSVEERISNSIEIFMQN